MSVVSEGLYYEWRAVRGQRLRWGWVIGGNLFSSVVILLIPYLTLCLKEAQPDLEGRVEPYHDGLWWASVGGSVLVFALSFRVPGWRRTQPEHGTVLGAFASPEPPGADSKLGSP